MAQQSVNLNSRRIESIDVLRGLVMVIMALDHTRDLFHKEAITGNPLDPGTTTFVLYFTRWVTHFCAPTFVFLSGLSAWLQGARKSKATLRRFLITRGIWLILVDLTVMTLGLTADIHFDMFLLQTFWSIGASMIVLGCMIGLPFRVILVTGLVIVLGHNLIDIPEMHHEGLFPWWWLFLHKQGFMPLWPGHGLLVLYPFLPWTGVMLLGYCCGKLFTDVDVVRRNRILLRTGVGMIMLFIALRYTNWYGNPTLWSKQGTALRTFFSFMNVQKYPPSLLFICATVGPGLIFLALVKNTGSRMAKIVSVYGRVPFFYFVVHFYVLHVFSILFYLSRGHTMAEGIKGMDNVLFKFAVPGEGFTLGQVYIMWVAVVILMYPLCRWYDRYRSAHREKWWLSYL